MSEWKPIESAPNGIHILFFPETTGRNAHRAMIKVDSYPVTYPRKPSHWMPLPEPPKD